MRRALPALVATGAGLAVVLRFHTTPLGAGAALAAKSGRPPATSAPRTPPGTGGSAAPPTTAHSAPTTTGVPTTTTGPTTRSTPTTTRSTPTTTRSAPTTAVAPPASSTTAPAAAAGARTADGPAVSSRFGVVQLEVTVQDGHIVDVTPLQLPGPNPRSRRISGYAEPYLRSEALAAQSAQIDTVSGATTTSEAYARSLQGALDQLR